MGFDLGGLLQQYLGANAQPQYREQATDDFQQLAQHAPPEMVEQGISEAFRSDQTPPFSQMIGQLFGNGNSQQQAGMLNQLLGGMNQGQLGGIGGGLGGGLLGGLLGNLLNRQNDQPVSVTPEQASQLSPEQVQKIAEQAEQQNPGIIDKMSSFYAAHPGLVNTIGSAALSIALAKIAQRMKQ